MASNNNSRLRKFWGGSQGVPQGVPDPTEVPQKTTVGVVLVLCLARLPLWGGGGDEGLGLKVCEGLQA